MPFEKGHKKTGGRKKGSLNKTSERIRLAFAKLLEDNVDTLMEDIEKMKPNERARFFLDMSNYIIPKLKSTELKTSNDNPIVPVINFTSSDKHK